MKKQPSAVAPLSTEFSFAVTTPENFINEKLSGFDHYMEDILSAWNAPGIGVGIVHNDKLVFTGGYGYRDYDNKGQISENTLFQIASNTKHFTAVAVGLLVCEGKIEWDKPVRNYIPDIKFFSAELDNNITIRDMLSHRSGIPGYDMVWINTDFSRKQITEKLKYLEPCMKPHEGFRYNNIMYGAAGYVIEVLSGKTWEDFIKEKILTPLGMTNTYFSINDMLKQSDYYVLYFPGQAGLCRVPYFEVPSSIASAGGIISNIKDLSKWVITLMNRGQFNGQQVIPEDVISETLKPAVCVDPVNSLDKGYFGLNGEHYGMGRSIALYRGHHISTHAGELPGIYSQVSFLLNNRVGVIVFTIGDHTYPLHDVITYNIYERLLGLDVTPWSAKILAEKASVKDTAAGISPGKLPAAKLLNPLKEYSGKYVNPAYGIINITYEETGLQFEFHKMNLPLNYYENERFNTARSELGIIFTVNFITNLYGIIDSLEVSLDERIVKFSRN
jgi:CubicO group peptidase (beta-lactamase class C family)